MKVIFFAASGLISIAGASAALFYFVIKQDKGDEPDSQPAVDSEVVKKPPT